MKRDAERNRKNKEERETRLLQINWNTRALFASGSAIVVYSTSYAFFLPLFILVLKRTPLWDAHNEARNAAILDDAKTEKKKRETTTTENKAKSRKTRLDERKKKALANYKEKVINKQQQQKSDMVQ